MNDKDGKAVEFDSMSVKHLQVGKMLQKQLMCGAQFYWEIKLG